MPKTLIISLCLLFSFALSAQHRCGTDEFIAKQDDNPKYQKYLKYLESLDKLSPEQRSSLVCADTKIIPVAVHFNDPVTCEDPVCLLEAVEAQLAVMNEDFLATNADYSYYTDLNSACSSAYPLSTAPVQGEGACIQFCLATQNHPAVSGLLDGDPAITVGEYEWASDAPDWSGYLNIFVDGSQGGLGVAWLPGAGDGDGFWVTPSAFGGPGFTCTSGTALNNNGTYNLGRTATHEAGHYLGLPHVFGSCNSDPDSNPPGPIAINDTPPQGSSFFGCPTINDCNDVPEDCGTEPQSIFSFMDYTDDACMVLFTADQSEVLNWHANNIPFTDDATLCGDSYGDVNCLEPVVETCVDGIQNQDEGDIDCGGLICDPCDNVCGINFYDSGGPNGSYGNNELETWVFCPDNPNEIITINFTAFDVERQNADACWDELRVYEGNGTGGTLLETTCGTTIAESPGGGSISAASPGGCLTFEFDSDGSVTPNGWEADISCEAAESDLTSIMLLLPNTASGVTDLLTTFTIQEVSGNPTIGSITLVLPKDDRLSVSFDQNATMVGGFPVNNIDWIYDGGNPNFHIWTSNAIIPASMNSKIGIIATYDPQGSSGISTYSATILNGSGGETNGLNNVDAETILYFSS